MKRTPAPEALAVTTTLERGRAWASAPACARAMFARITKDAIKNMKRRINIAFTPSGFTMN
jgi:hypothetical protein